MKATILSAIVVAAVLTGAARADVSVEFDLLTWDDTQATAELPSAVGDKPASGQLTTNDWLVFTTDDVNPGSATNPAGALSHNLAEPAGSIPASDPRWQMAPSLTGRLGLSFSAVDESSWSVNANTQAYQGQADSTIFMNQFLITPGSAAASASGVDGSPNSGAWQADASGNWAIQYALDFYLATSIDFDSSPDDVDAAFDNAQQNGYLIPVDQLTPAGMSGVTLTSLSGFFNGNFEQYLLDEIAPRLPEDATFLLVTQMDKTNPAYGATGLPIDTDSFVGNTTIAYTTQPIPEPTSLALLVAGGVGLAMRRRRRLSANA